MRSLKDRAVVSLTYNWHHYYYTLNEDGIKYLKQ